MYFIFIIHIFLGSRTWCRWCCQRCWYFNICSPTSIHSRIECPIIRKNKVNCCWFIIDQRLWCSWGWWYWSHFPYHHKTFEGKFSLNHIWMFVKFDIPSNIDSMLRTDGRKFGWRSGWGEILWNHNRMSGHENGKSSTGFIPGPIFPCSCRWRLWCRWNLWCFEGKLQLFVNDLLVIL